jgi:hypothetical protein
MEGIRFGTGLNSGDAGLLKRNQSGKFVYDSGID